jgi:hypothetical protein
MDVLIRGKRFPVKQISLLVMRNREKTPASLIGYGCYYTVIPFAQITVAAPAQVIGKGMTLRSPGNSKAHSALLYGQVLILKTVYGPASCSLYRRSGAYSSSSQYLSIG